MEQERKSEHMEPQAYRAQRHEPGSKIEKVNFFDSPQVGCAHASNTACVGQVKKKKKKRFAGPQRQRSPRAAHHHSPW